MTMQVTANPNIEKVLKEQGFVVSAVHGDSMLPMLDQNKDLVRLVPVSGKLPRYGLPLYRRPNGKLVLHRIIGVRKDHYVTCGDNRTVSEKVPFDWVIAVAEGYYKDGTYIPVSDAEYMKYVRRHCRGRWRRKIIVPSGDGSGPTDGEKRALIALMRDAMSGTDGGVISDELKNAVEGVDMLRVFRLAVRQGVAAAAWRAARNLSLDENLRTSWSAAADRALRRELLFDAEWKSVSSRFDDAGISYVPLKGTLIKSLWREAGMREFSDYDILVDPARSDDVREIMLSLGYRVAEEGEVHDSYQREPIFNFEMHKQLFASKKSLGKAFAGVTDRLCPFGGEGSSEMRMTVGEEYAYIIAHIFKHYDSSGAGLRSFADIWLINRKFAADGVDRAEIDAALCKAGVENFEKKALSIAEAIFGEGEMLSDKDYDALFCGGIYGKGENKLSADVRKEGRAGYFFRRAFMPLSEMKNSYPVLEKCPVLLPFCYIHRAFYALLFKRRRVAKEIRAITSRKDYE